MSSKVNIVGLYHSHRGDLVNYASNIVGDRSKAEDVVQEAFIRFDKAAGNENLLEPLAYLYRIVRNLALDTKRQLTREQGRHVDDNQISLDQAEENRPSPETQTGDRQELQRLRMALKELPERTQIALEMHWFGNYTVREIAGFLDISVGLAHSLLVDGLEHCRGRLNREAEKI